MTLNIKYPTVKVIYDRRKTARENAPATIEIEIAMGRQRKWISTGVRILPHQWHPQFIVANHPDSFSLRLKVETAKKNVQDFINLCMINKEEFTFQRLKESLAEKKYDGSFIDYAALRIEERQDIAPGTRRNHMKIISALKAFGKIRLFSELTRQNIIDFDQWLHGKGYKQVTIHSYHKFMKVYIHMAMLQNLVSKDPYEGVRIKEGKTVIRKYLTEAEIAKIRDCRSLPSSLSRVRDLFMFQFYTGVAYADLCRFDFSKVVEREGKHILHAARAKTEEPYYIVIIPQAMEILERY
ncbi:MAG: site-specific integrase, partial [Muribaculaceae bacterium]|nr:site-specific integrase [Muribaculaceae bacterium]